MCIFINCQFVVLNYIMAEKSNDGNGGAIDTKIGTTKRGDDVDDLLLQIDQREIEREDIDHECDLIIHHEKTMTKLVDETFPIPTTHSEMKMTKKIVEKLDKSSPTVHASDTPQDHCRQHAKTNQRHRTRTLQRVRQSSLQHILEYFGLETRQHQIHVGTSIARRNFRKKSGRCRFAVERHERRWKIEFGRHNQQNRSISKSVVGELEKSERGDREKERTKSFWTILISVFSLSRFVVNLCFL